jgi:hypothetical protein
LAGKNNDIQKDEMDIQGNSMTKSFRLTQKLMAELFQTTKQNISLHIRLCTFNHVCTFIPKLALLFENIVRVLLTFATKVIFAPKVWCLLLKSKLDSNRFAHLFKKLHIKSKN